jgi:glycosyltransferase involved in cell wall biosynthesis
MPPFFSIIIPVYNSASSLPATIDSLAKQTFKNFEIVFVDGASKDGTMQIINELKKANNDFHVIALSEPDKGIYDAMNKGIDLATGEWLYFMGSDDQLYSPDVLESIYNEIQKGLVDLIYGNVTGEGSRKHYVHDSMSKIMSGALHHQGIFYKRPVFEFTGKYERFFKVSADYHLTLKILSSPQFKTRYVNIDVAIFGEGGLSSNVFDYTLLSGHYKFLMQHNGISKLDKPEEVLDTSMYCSFYLLKEKKNMAFAWKNLLYYAATNTHLNPTARLKTIFRTLYWTLKPKEASLPEIK